MRGRQSTETARSQRGKQRERGGGGGGQIKSERKRTIKTEGKGERQ